MWSLRVILVIAAIVFFTGAATTVAAPPPPLIAPPSATDPTDNSAPADYSSPWDIAGTPNVIDPNDPGYPEGAMDGDDRVSTATCAGVDDHGSSYAYYERGALAAKGAASRVDITWNSTTLKSGHVNGFVGPANHDQTAWIQAGLERSSGDSNISGYIEVNANGVPVPHIVGTASAKSTYTAKVKRVNTNVWTASVGGVPLGTNATIYGLTATQFVGESFRDTSTTKCNKMNINFSNPSWYTSNMTPHTSPHYFIDQVTNTGWRSYGG